FTIFLGAKSRYSTFGKTLNFFEQLQTMAPIARVRANTSRVWRNLHMWLGVGLGLLLVPIAFAGSLLVWHDTLDALVHPARYAVTAGVARPASELMAAAENAAPGFRPLVIRFADGAPAQVSVRESGTRDARPRLRIVYLDPPTGRVLDIVDFRNSFIGVLHRFHENLTLPDYNGRAIVGWMGVAMLIMSLTGLYLWWPRGSRVSRGLRWRRGPETISNLHHLIGFWISLPLAVVSLTGLYLGFPQQGRALLAAVAPMSQQPRPFAGSPLRQPQRSIDEALATAMTDRHGRPAAIFVPSEQTQTWRIQLRAADGVRTILVNDRTGIATTSAELSGDRVARILRGIHDGSLGGPIWQVVVFACGIAPAILAFTGIIVWLRRRSRRLALARPGGTELS